ncbi:hypothetical protein, partial [Mesorhizobium sp. M2D.F.Ca.ET.223.01.1.1]|uniref:hypothetical protein n=1 Tax=Mesorhizobium sp. M2D.F.Ca.ET.223.01.1.1 TaxID=2563940 RepID=UPI001AED1812
DVFLYTVCSLYVQLESLRIPTSLAVGSVGESMMSTALRYADASKTADVFARNKKPAHLVMRGPFSSNN